MSDWSESDYPVVCERIIDDASLYRLSTETHFGALDSQSVRFAEAIAERIDGKMCSHGLILNGNGIAEGVVLDVVVGTAARVPYRDLFARMRNGGILLIHEGLVGAVALESAAAGFIAIQIASAAEILTLLIKATPIHHGPNAYGVHLHRPVYNGVLQPGDWCFPAGRWSLLIGRSGTGKTTLLELIVGARHETDVERHMNGGRVFYLPQDAEAIMGARVDANIRLFASTADASEEAIRRLGLHGLRSRKVDDRLSGGERQRVAIGQALAAAPEMMILDEPSANLDHIRRRQIFYYLKNNVFGSSTSTVLCVAHDFMPIQSQFDHVFEIMHGHMVQHTT